MLIVQLLITISLISFILSENLKADNDTSFGVKCFHIQNWNVYDLKGLQRSVKNTTYLIINTNIQVFNTN